MKCQDLFSLKNNEKYPRLLFAFSHDGPSGLILQGFYYIQWIILDVRLKNLESNIYCLL